MKRKIVTIIGLVACTIGLYSFLTYSEKDKATPNVKELVHDYSVGNLEAESASITSQQLLVTNKDNSEVTYDLPENEFFVSIAPYVNQTHPCANHSLTSCRGEMVSEQFDVYIEDAEGNVLVDDVLTSHANGFIDLWLPRDKIYHITISNDGKTGQSEFSTFKNDNTCMTTIQLMETKGA
jgi:hypothetical protein